MKHQIGYIYDSFYYPHPCPFYLTEVEDGAFSFVFSFEEKRQDGEYSLREMENELLVSSIFSEQE